MFTRRETLYFNYLIVVVTWPDVALTGSDRKYVPRMSCFFPRFFLSIAVVQVPWLTEVTKGHVIPSGFLWVCACETESCAISILWNCVPMRNRNLRNIRPSGSFWEVTSSSIGLPLEVEGGCSVGRPRPMLIMATGTSPFTGYLLLLFS